MRSSITVALALAAASASAPRADAAGRGRLSHSVPDAWLPAMHGGTLGGTAEGTMGAFASYWPAIVSFLDRSLLTGR